MDYTNNGPLKVVYGDYTFGVHGSGFDYIFSYAQGGLESIVKDGCEWLYRCPKPTFWRALTDNDRGSDFHLKSGMWMAADMFMKCKNIQVAVDGVDQRFPCAPQNNRYGGDVYAYEAKISFVYETITVPSTEVKVDYIIEKSGRMKVEVHYFGKEGLPQLPVFGMRFLMPSVAEKYIYEGLSGETYPDRKAGASQGIFVIDDLSLTPYLVPQECGMRMDTKWVEITRVKQGLHTLRIEANDSAFAFSCLPYTAEEIENATHHEELPLPRRTVFCIYGAVRGVGGIDSWGSDVEDAYHISAEKDIKFSFVIA